MASKTGKVWAVCLVAIVAQAVAPAMTAADTGCAVITPVNAKRPAQEVAASRTGRIPGLGAVAASVGWDNRSSLVLSDRDFTVSRSFTPLTREVELVIGGTGEEPLVIRFGGAEGLSVARAGVVHNGAADPDAMRALLGGRAIAAFRERVGNYERRLMAGASPRVDDPHGYGFLLAGAFVASLAGDPAAFGRARDVMQRRIRGRILAARFDFSDCVTDYELYLLKIDKQRTLCLEAANSRDSWYARAADRLGCEAEFMAQALAGEGQFISCTALGSIL
jgi:hypothetical protein